MSLSQIFLILQDTIHTIMENATTKTVCELLQSYLVLIFFQFSDKDRFGMYEQSKHSRYWFMTLTAGVEEGFPLETVTKF